ncbi:MAG: tRNA lysidine(34) synthetase TilS, partial [Deltaproteobacteria bacterium]
LEISRHQIEEYLRERALIWREDSSNSDTSYLRNRIRHELLPILEGYNPAIRSCLSGTAAVIGDDEALLDELTEQAFSQVCRMDEGKFVCAVGQLRTLNIALRRRVLRHAFKQMTGNLERISRQHIDAICNMIDSNRPNSRLALPHKVTAVREYDRLLLRQSPETSPNTVPDLLITAPGCYLLPTGGLVTIEISDPPSDFNALPSDTACFDLDKVPFPWLIRTFRAGDRIIPFGMSGRKKVKDIFIDRKIPVSERKHIPLLFYGSDLIWIVGVCASELCRIDDTSNERVKVTWHE